MPTSPQTRRRTPSAWPSLFREGFYLYFCSMERILQSEMWSLVCNPRNVTPRAFETCQRAQQHTSRHDPPCAFHGYDRSPLSISASRRIVEARLPRPTSSTYDHSFQKFRSFSPALNRRFLFCAIFNLYRARRSSYTGHNCTPLLEGTSS